MPGPFITDENQKQVKYIFISDNTNNAQGFVFNYNYVRLPGIKNLIIIENILNNKVFIPTLRMSIRI